jgi:hypothetical protein
MRHQCIFTPFFALDRHIDQNVEPDEIGIAIHDGLNLLVLSFDQFPDCMQELLSQHVSFFAEPNLRTLFGNCPFCSFGPHPAC